MRKRQEKKIIKLARKRRHSDDLITQTITSLLRRNRRYRRNDSEGDHNLLMSAIDISNDMTFEKREWRRKATEDCYSDDLLHEFYSGEFLRGVSCLSCSAILRIDKAERSLISAGTLCRLKHTFRGKIRVRNRLLTHSSVILIIESGSSKIGYTVDGFPAIIDTAFIEKI